ncbi:MAG: hypothetical protein A2X78_05040 [Gammaproteobacteria bacterium GWE2_37_16]|nr:MAG: hypothetical protein A2X78_05040 [Gammaproteobacteria bacterium GWE2_37_16]
MRKISIATVAAILGLMMTGCSYLAAKNPDQLPNTRREQICSNLKDKMTTNQGQGGLYSGSGQQSLPTDSARMIKSYQRNDCSNFENNAKP